MTPETNPLADLSRIKMDAAHKQIRGSSLLLGGKVLQLGMKFLAQLILVRYLVKADYGAWTYALAVVGVLEPIAALGLERAIPRFAAIYHEKRENGKLLGSVALIALTIACIALLLAAVVFGAPHLIESLLPEKKAPLGVLCILLFLVPVDGLNLFLEGMFAGFGKSKAIFMRQHLMGPGLRLATVCLLVWRGSNVEFLAAGYLIAGILAVFLNLALLTRLFRRMGLCHRDAWKETQLPAREMFSFSLPLLASDLATACASSAATLLLGWYYSLENVALFTVVVPLADLNMAVIRSFSLLYTSNAARLYARGDEPGIRELYRRTALWMAVLTFPIFAVTFSLAEPLVTMLYGPRYTTSGTILAILAVGNYFNVVLGFNGITLRVLGHVRQTLMISFLACATSLVLSCLLVPRLGPLGAGLAACGTMIAHNIYKQVWLHRAIRIRLLDPQFFLPLWRIVIIAGVLLALERLIPNNIWLLAILAAIGTSAVVILSKKTLRVAETFPELMRIPGLRSILA